MESVSLTRKINEAAKIKYSEFLLIENTIHQLRKNSYKVTDTIRALSKKIDNEKPLGCKFADIYHSLYFNHKFNNIFKGASVLELGGALPASFSRKYLKVNNWTSIEKSGWNYDHKNSNDGSQHINNAKHISFDFFEHFSPPDPLKDWVQKTTEKMIEPLAFNLVYSIAAFEHIDNLEETLDIAYSCLQPGGALVAFFSEIWSSPGGHLGTTIPGKIKQMYGHHAHLSLNINTMADALTKMCNYSQKDAIKTANYIFKEEGINRLLMEDYLEIFRDSRFKIKNIIPENSIDFNQYYPNNPGIVKLITDNHPKARSSCHGFTILLVK